VPAGSGRGPGGLRDRPESAAVSGRLLVVGAGRPGCRWRAAPGWDGPITLIGEEPYAPYTRPPVSKAFLKGEASPESLALRSAASYTEQRIELVLDEQIAHLDLVGERGGPQTPTHQRVGLPLLLRARRTTAHQGTADPRRRAALARRGRIRIR
jgi:hypothetical protein